MVGTMEQTVADARGYFSGWRSVTFDRIAAKVGVTKSRRVFSFRAQKRSPENGHVLWVK